MAYPYIQQTKEYFLRHVTFYAISIFFQPSIIPNVTIDGITDGNLIGSTDRLQNKTAVGKTYYELVSSGDGKEEGTTVVEVDGNNEGIVVRNVDGVAVAVIDGE